MTGQDVSARRTPEECTLVAHRGFAGEHPENTVAAFEAASRRADLIELDVVATADGDVVVFHDDDLAGRDGGARGLTDASGLVRETDTATVTRAEVLESGETVPRLSAALEAIPPTVGVNVELKNPGRSDLRIAEKLDRATLSDRTDAWRPFVTRVVETLEAYDNEVLCSSFCEGALAATREVSSYPIAPICWRSVEDALAIAERHDAAAIHPPVELVGGTPFTDGSVVEAEPGLIERAHAADRAVNVWTVTTWYEATQLAAAGVDGLISDYAGVVDR